MNERTPEQKNDDFVSEVLFNPAAVLASAVEWVAGNMDPQEVFDRTQLEDWAKMNGWTPPPQE